MHGLRYQCKMSAKITYLDLALLILTVDSAKQRKLKIKITQSPALGRLIARMLYVRHVGLCLKSLPGLSVTFRVGGDLRRVGGAGCRLQNTADPGHKVARGEHIRVHPLFGGSSPGEFFTMCLLFVVI